MKPTAKLFTAALIWGVATSTFNVAMASASPTLRLKSDISSEVYPTKNSAVYSAEIAVKRSLGASQIDVASCRLFSEDLIAAVSPGSGGQDRIIIPASAAIVAVGHARYWEGGWECHDLLKPCQATYLDVEIPSMNIRGQLECFYEYINPADTTRRTGLRWLSRQEIRAWLFDFSDDSIFPGPQQ